MALSYTEMYDLKNPGAGASVSELKKKTTVAVASQAQAILAEPQNTPNHNARTRWATNALINAEAMGEAMMWCVLSNGDVQTNGQATADATVQYVVDVSVNIFAA